MNKLQLNTPSRQAFERYTEAVSCIESFRASGRAELAKRSQTLLEEAHIADPNWVRPAYLQSILKDLTGDPDTAIHELELFSDVPDSSFSVEVNYNLGAAHYHRYGEAHLKEAERLFGDVILKASRRSQPLALLASSSLAQVYGMGVLLKQPANFAQLKKDAKKAYARCVAQARSALRGLEKWKRSKLFESDKGGAWIADEIEWGATNAIGFAGSFWSDYLSPRARIPILERSINVFEKGLELRPNHWATLSNLASAKMRLGYALHAIGQTTEGEHLLEEALQNIDRVLAPDIRPNYAFALYERGRILRLLGRFDEAIESLSKLRSFPPEKRDVSAATFESEIECAQKRQAYFLRANTLSGF